ncbi:MAG: hypothetical protein ACI379_12045 [Nocardioides sp.]|uniref:hypothetical protein n=1 Tax=Nocardioides sp. TaxID=35761 RepID=UPI003F021620
MTGDSRRTVDLVAGILGMGLLACLVLAAGFFALLGGGMAAGSCVQDCPDGWGDALVFGGAGWPVLVGLATGVLFVVRGMRRQSVWWLPWVGMALAAAGTWIALSVLDSLLA